MSTTKTIIAVTENIEALWRTALEDVPDVAVHSEAPASAILSEGAVLPLEVLRVAGPAVEHLDEQPPIEPGWARLLIIEAVLDDRSAVQLEDRNIAYVDASGRAWVPGTPRSASRAPVRRRTRTASIRAAQLLADYPDTDWTESSLSKQAVVSSGTAHNLTRDLVALDLVERFGRGKKAGLRVRDFRGLRRWLVEVGKSDQPLIVTCFIPKVEQLPNEVDGVPLIRTGAEGARRLGLPVMSSIAQVMVRVPIQTGLEDFPARLGGLRATVGANIALVSDRDRFALNDARMVDGVWIAPPSRVAVDLTFEPRGDSASAVFLDLWGEDLL